MLLLYMPQGAGWSETNYTPGTVPINIKFTYSLF